jgi:hypothetical protein
VADWARLQAAKVFSACSRSASSVKSLLHAGAYGVAGVGVQARHRRVVVPAAGVGAGALVGVAPVEVATEQAAPAVGNAQCAVDEYFQLYIGAFLADFFYLVQAQFARQDDALQRPPFART